MSKLAVVTGGTRGIGAAISKRLKKKGYMVAATYAHNDNIAKEFEAENDIKVYKFDVANLEECEKAIARIANDFETSPAILVNNAGITSDSTLHKMTSEQWSKVISTNLDSCFNMCKCVIPQMREKGYGRIVNISSINALAGQFGQTNYSAAKAGIIGFSKALARESAAKGITVNVVAPGYIKTDMTDAVPVNVMDTIISQIPVRRLGKVNEIARAVEFLVDDDAGFITGETLSVNGGQHME
ncbi:MAG: 3-oxoacyl-ACP reductase [Rickettsiales bacterium]|nr:3-oxoacyl-ACP reductase [Pseudomonadota bacterium]MDA0966523.1 3-oxoacyl-ACP reductase [Pseudomonadota bacterium]MDG4543385.1 3-oxoacyl-ACP reductase [Rickettsiales bacterium]MDG4545651.1 3-oxoacyl-ACP reductase [Rickettsiales bacterium]MDG4548100.1 3-oxoacyl-ACP reductase [Rickettsiales bacterium]